MEGLADSRMSEQMEGSIKGGRRTNEEMDGLIGGQNLLQQYVGSVSCLHYFLILHNLYFPCDIYSTGGP
jgi:hypothetical protein